MDLFLLRTCPGILLDYTDPRGFDWEYAIPVISAVVISSNGETWALLLIRGSVHEFGTPR